MLPEATSYPFVSITTFPSLSKINIDKFLISSLDKIALYILSDSLFLKKFDEFKKL